MHLGKWEEDGPGNKLEAQDDLSPLGRVPGGHRETHLRCGLSRCKEGLHLVSDTPPNAGLGGMHAGEARPATLHAPGNRAVWIWDGLCHLPEPSANC